MITTAIVFDHRGRTKKNDEGPLEVRITINRKPYYINTGVRVRARQWQYDRVINHPQSDVINDRLSIILGKVMGKVNACINMGIDVDIQKIKREIWSADDDQMFLEWIRDEVKLLNVRPGTMEHYETLVRRVEQYGGFRSWADITVENIYKWDAWLRKLKGNYGYITLSGVHNYHKNLKSLLSRAVRSGKITANPYFSLRGEFSKGEKESTEYLTEDEMAKIEEMNPTPGTTMEMARDLFVFQMYTGLSYSDAEAFDIRKYKKVDGKWRIVGNRIKTGEPFVNQLLPPAVAVLEKYDYKIPQLSNKVYNDELKEIGKAAGIEIKLHSHLARHTFATFMLRHGVKVENLAKMLGHANIKQTQRYAKVLAESVHEDFEKIDALLTKK